MVILFTNFLVVLYAGSEYGLDECEMSINILIFLKMMISLAKYIFTGYKNKFFK
jgi:hypothetical protein